jgi:N,N'-diacetyllegionaminate synthase
MRILGVVPARGGSKGLPGKNIKPLGGIPLLGRAILGAKEAGCLDRLWVSTDDPAIAAVGEAFGVKVPWLRPARLAQDGSLLTDAIIHLLDKLKKDEGYEPDAVLVLQPTSPFRTAATIKKAVALFAKKRRPVISVAPAVSHPFWCYKTTAGGDLKPFLDHIVTPPPRQKLPPAFFLDGSIFLASVKDIRKNRSFYTGNDVALPVSMEDGIDIDTPQDWARAEEAERRRSAAARKGDAVYIIAEAGVNHNGDQAKAKALVDAAAVAGADAVKFQTFKAEALAAKTAPKASYQEHAVPGTTQFDMLKALELDESAHRDLQKHAQRAGITFLSTPFDEDSLDFLVTLKLPILKLGSGEVTNKPLLRRAARTGKPVILSTGMSTLAEVAAAVNWLREAGCKDLTLLHCLTEYPAPVSEVNLRAMDTLASAFGVAAGYSDHTPGIEISLAAAARGARVIEKHLTLDRTLPGPDHAASIEPNELKALVAGVRAIEKALGDGEKRVAPSEAANRAIGRRSLVSARALERGHALKLSDFVYKRPGTGIPPGEAEAVVGRKLKRRVGADEVLTWDALA